MVQTIKENKVWNDTCLFSELRTHSFRFPWLFLLFYSFNSCWSSSTAPSICVGTFAVNSSFNYFKLSPYTSGSSSSCPASRTRKFVSTIDQGPKSASLQHRKFRDNVAAQFWYLFKCIYFGYSSIQVRLGYPKRIAGNFLMKRFNYVNQILYRMSVSVDSPTNAHDDDLVLRLDICSFHFCWNCERSWTGYSQIRHSVCRVGCNLKISTRIFTFSNVLDGQRK